jgi:ribosome-binding ATPase YchF (GTP1/OBG family)
LKEHLDAGRWIRNQEWTNAEITRINKMMLFSAKPMVYLVNISKEDFLSKKNKWLAKIKTVVEEKCPGKIIPFSVDFEQSLG